MVEPTKLGEDERGELFALPVPYTDQKMLSSVGGQTPDLTPDRHHQGETGPIPRASSGGSVRSSIDLQTFSLNSAELSTTLKRFRDEMYRNQFPELVPKFLKKCTECGAEYDDEVESCEICDGTDFRGPSPQQRREGQKFFRSVNHEDQSLRSLMKYEEDIQSFYGISIIVARQSYEAVRRQIRIGDNTVTEVRDAVQDSVDELVHGDPLSILPVTDENNRQGGWWICPIHRDGHWTEDDLKTDEQSGEVMSTCPECGCRLREVGYVETGDSRDDVESYFLIDEVVDWARHFPQMSGLDGRSPVMALIKLQAIIQFNRSYEAAFFDPANSEQLPNKMVLAYGQNIRESLSATFNEESDKDSWETGQVMYDGDPDDVEIEVIDLTPQDALQGRDRMVERLQSQIRAMWGVSDAIENELSDAGGLNAEGMQIEITNSTVASAQADTMDRALQKIEDLIGLDDWRIEYVNPKRERHELNVNQKVAAIENAQRAGLSGEISQDGQLILDAQTFGREREEDVTETTSEEESVSADEDESEVVTENQE